MKRVLLAALSAALISGTALAQSADELVKGGSDTANVLNYGMGYHLQRYSPLTQIDKQTVKRLAPVWNYSFDDNRSEESQAFVYRGVIYITSNAATMAVDAKTGKQLWKTKVDYPPETPRVVCCGINNRGVAVYDGKVFRGTLDANVVALDAVTGKEVWRQKAIDFRDGYAMTGAPLIADNVLITGIAGAEYGTRGFLDGWDPQTGNHLWRTFTIPGPGEPGNDSWPGDAWQRGGSTTWITGSFDPQLHTVYWGTGNPGPWYDKGRKGDLLYSCSVLALDPKTGKIKWHYQFSPGNPFDYDAVAEMVLADIPVNGTPRKVILNANRNGFFYVLDRTNGQLLAANPYVKVTWASGIDMKTGRPIETDITERARAGEDIVFWPSIMGGKNWEPISYDPKRGLAYANTINIGGRYHPVDEEFKKGEMYLGVKKADFWEYPEGPRGYLKALEPLTGKAKWQAPSDEPRFSGVLSTAGGVVFAGQLTGEFEAFDSDTGKKLWQFQTGSGIEGQPVTWQQDGTQYIAVASGIGGLYSIYSGDERLKKVPPGGSLWTFALQR